MGELKHINMNKRGFVDGFSLIVFILVAGAIAGATYLTTQQGNQIDISSYYGANSELKIVYPPSCQEQIKNIPINNTVYFQNLELALSYNYIYVGC